MLESNNPVVHEVTRAENNGGFVPITGQISYQSVLRKLVDIIPQDRLSIRDDQPIIIQLSTGFSFAGTVRSLGVRVFNDAVRTRVISVDVDQFASCDSMLNTGLGMLALDVLLGDQTAINALADLAKEAGLLYG